MTEVIYECVVCEYRERDEEGDKPASYACPECRGVMRRAHSPREG